MFIEDVGSYLTEMRASVLGVSRDLTPYDLPEDVILITGGSSGIGFGIAELMSQYHPKAIIITSRSAERGEVAVQKLKEKTGYENFACEELDLGDFESVEALAERVKDKYGYISTLYLNAGQASLSKNDKQFTKDGLPVILQGNVLGHHLLVELCVPLLLNNPDKPARVVFQSSFLLWLGVLNLKHFAKFPYILQYNSSKLLNMMQVRGFAEKFNIEHEGKIIVHGAHPGFVDTPLVTQNGSYLWNLVMGRLSKCLMVPQNVGAQTSVYLGTDPSVEKGPSGLFWASCTKQKYRPIANNPEKVRELMATLDYCIKNKKIPA